MVPPKDTSIHKFTWADLTSLVYEQMCNLVTSSQRTDEKVSKGKIILCFKIPLQYFAVRVNKLIKNHHELLNVKRQ